MIRGSIEVAQKTRVAGWIFCSADSVRDKLVLAFVGARCVGAGKVDRFRKDLLDAKLGDGYCGYDFPIKLQDGETVGAIVVRLQNSDASLIQATTRLSGPDDHSDADSPDLGAIAPAAVVWMQDRGMLEQPEHDFLRAVQTIGAYERGLRPARRGTAEIQPALKPEAVAQDLLSLYVLGDVTVTRSQVAGIAELGGEKSPLRQSPISVVALWAEERGRIVLDERSHLGPVAGRGQVLADAPPGGIEYNYGPDRLLLLHKACSFAPRGPAPAGGVVLFTAAPRQVAENGRRAA